MVQSNVVCQVGRLNVISLHFFFVCFFPRFCSFTFFFVLLFFCIFIGFLSFFWRWFCCTQPLNPYASRSKNHSGSERSSQHCQPCSRVRLYPLGTFFCSLSPIVWHDTDSVQKKLVPRWVPDLINSSNCTIRIEWSRTAK